MKTIAPASSNPSTNSTQVINPSSSTSPLRGIHPNTTTESPQVSSCSAGMKDLPVELLLPLFEQIPHEDMRAFAEVNHAFNASAQHFLMIARQKAQEIQKMPLENLDHVKEAFKLVKDVPQNLKHLPLKPLAERLIFLPHELWKDAEELFLAQCSISYKSDCKIEDAIQYLQWSQRTISAKACADSNANISDEILSNCLTKIDHYSRKKRCSEDCVLAAYSKCGFDRTNAQYFQKFIQHARYRELYDMADYKPNEIINGKKLIKDMIDKEGMTADQAVDSLEARFGRSSAKDTLVFKSYALELAPEKAQKVEQRLSA